MGMAAKGPAPSIAARPACAAARVAECGKGRVCALSSCAASAGLRGRSPVAISQRVGEHKCCSAQLAKSAPSRLVECVSGNLAQNCSVPPTPSDDSDANSRPQLSASSTWWSPTLRWQQRVRRLPRENRGDRAIPWARTLRRRTQGVGRTRGQWCVRPRRPSAARPAAPLASPVPARNSSRPPPPLPPRRFSRPLRPPQNFGTGATSREKLCSWGSRRRYAGVRVCRASFRGKLTNRGARGAFRKGRTNNWPSRAGARSGRGGLPCPGCALAPSPTRPARARRCCGQSRP